MFRGFSLICFPLVLQASAGSEVAQDVSERLIQSPIFEGGTYEDQRFARAALGFRVGQNVDAERLRIGLNAIRATDRFKNVESRLEDADGGKILRLYLEPWPTLNSVITNITPELKKRVKPWLREIRKGTKPGDFVLDAWIKRAEEWLAVWGYPSAKVEISRSELGDSIKVSIDAGQPNLVRQVDLSGVFGAASHRSILNALDCKPGQTIWTTDVQQKAVQRLNRLFARSNHLFAKVDFSWNPENGKLSVEVNAGPVVKLGINGAKMGISKLKEHLSLPGVDRFGTDLLTEAERRLLGIFLADSQPLATVRHTLSALDGKSSEEAVRLEYIVSNADVLRIADIKIQGNVEIEESELLKAAKTDLGGFLWKKPKAVPELVDSCLNHVLSYCLSLGYADARVRSDWIVEAKQATLQITVSEGKRQMLDEIGIVFETSRQQDIENVVKELFDFFGLNKIQTEGNAQLEFRPGNKEWINGLMRWESSDQTSYKLVMLEQTPFIRVHVAAVRSVIQHALASIGVINPIVTVNVEMDERGGVNVQLHVPQQNIQRLRRMIIQGVEHTKADFVLAEMRPKPNQPGIGFGDPLVISSIIGARTNLGSFGIFSSVDARSMEEATGGSAVGPSPWLPGDMLFRLTERPLWNFSNAFSYDRSVGYQIGIGAQRINIGGQAKTMDFSIRAGDGTINNPTLRSLFPTGNPGRSLDVYSIAFSDPWLSTKSLSGLLAERGLWRNEYAYIKERQGAYLIFRRRLVSSIEWRVRDFKNDIRTVRFGYRFENVGVQGPDAAEMQDQVRSPDKSILSIPFIQLIRDTRDHPFDPRRGSVSSLQFDIALQTLGTSANSSFIKVDFRHNWNIPVGEGARFGVTSLSVRLGAARPTASSSLEMPLSERFFAGGPNSHRGIEPDQLGPFGVVFLREYSYPYEVILQNTSPLYQVVPIGGQGIALVNLDYRFPLPLVGQWIWGELFIDSGEVYSRIREYDLPDPFLPPFPHWRTAIGMGLILRLGGFPIKVEYSWDVRKMMGKVDNEIYSRYADRTRLKNLLVSAGFQF